MTNILLYITQLSYTGFNYSNQKSNQNRKSALHRKKKKNFNHLLETTTLIQASYLMCFDLSLHLFSKLIHKNLKSWERWKKGKGTKQSEKHWCLHGPSSIIIISEIHISCMSCFYLNGTVINYNFMNTVIDY